MVSRLGLIAHVVVVVFVVAILHRIFCIWRYTLYIRRETQTHILPTKINENKIAKVSSSNNNCNFRTINHSTTPAAAAAARATATATFPAAATATATAAAGAAECDSTVTRTGFSVELHNIWTSVLDLFSVLCFSVLVAVSPSVVTSAQ